MAGINKFLKSPLLELLDGYTKEQLLKIAEVFEIQICDKRLKESVKRVLKANLNERNVLEEDVEKPCSVDAAGNNVRATKRHAVYTVKT